MSQQRKLQLVCGVLRRVGNPIGGFQAQNLKKFILIY